MVPIDNRVMTQLGYGPRLVW